MLAQHQVMLNGGRKVGLGEQDPVPGHEPSSYALAEPFEVYASPTPVVLADAIGQNPVTTGTFWGPGGFVLAENTLESPGIAYDIDYQRFNGEVMHIIDVSPNGHIPQVPQPMAGMTTTAYVQPPDPGGQPCLR